MDHRDQTEQEISAKGIFFIFNFDYAILWKVTGHCIWTHKFLESVFLCKHSVMMLLPQLDQALTFLWNDRFRWNL